MRVTRYLPAGLTAVLRPWIIAGRRRVAGRRRINLADGVVCRLLGDPAWETFFGYYDLSPFEPQGKRLLACRVKRDRPGAMEVGFYSAVAARSFTPVAATETWCWQQGCRLAWVPAFGSGQVVFNTLGKDAYAAVVFDVDGGKETARFARPLYDISPDGRYGLSVNFSRLQRLRPGYGYSQFPDAAADTAAVDDGIWLVDLAANESRLLHSLAEVAAVAPQESMNGAVHYFNHLAWNPSGTRFLFFHIWEPANRRRMIRLLTSDAEGNLQVVTNQRMVSHYCWTGDRHMLLFAELAGVNGYYEVADRPDGAEQALRCAGMPGYDGHPTWNAGAGRFVFDSLPDRLSERTLMTFRPGEPGPRILASFYSPPFLSGERRCDLHPRWPAAGAAIAVDTAHSGYRQIAVIEPSA